MGITKSTNSMLPYSWHLGRQKSMTKQRENLCHNAQHA